MVDLIDSKGFNVIWYTNRQIINYFSLPDALKIMYDFFLLSSHNFGISINGILKTTRRILGRKSWNSDFWLLYQEQKLALHVLFQNTA